ncbi:hypothetical protein CPC16_003131 [Podila verticillata]|nr:hypothetical protein CPC16_003131 [Podila verticillata]
MLSSSSSVGSVNLNYYDLDYVLTPPETEHNWAAKETAIKNLGAACHSGIAQNHEYIQFIKNHRKAFAESLLTERTRLSGAACELVEKLATAMGRDFSFHCGDLFTGPLLKVCARTNKVMVSRAVKALTSMINAGTISVLPKTCAAFASPNKTQRIACINLIAVCVSQFSSQELEPHLPGLEPVLKEGVQDAAPEVRDTSRKSFKVYAAQFPERSTVLTSTLPGNVLKYLLPDTRSSASLLGRPTTPGLAGRRSPMGRLADGGDAMRTNSTRELITGPTRAAATSRVGPVRARTMPVSEGPSALKASSVQHAPSTTQPYNYGHNQPSKPTTSTLSSSSSRHLGMRATSYSESSSTTDGLGGAPPLRSASQRSRNLTSGSIANSNLMQRSQAINLTSNGGPQRVVSGGHFSNNHAHSTSTHTNTNGSDLKPRPTSFLRPSKAEPSPKAGRISASSGNAEPMSASERAKAYSASLKNEMAIRRAGSASADLTMRNNGPRRLNMDQHIQQQQQQQQQQQGYSVYGSSASSSSVASISTSTAPSTSSVSPISSTSTSPITVHSPAHDQLFNSFRGPMSSQTASSPPESCASPDYGRRQSPPPTSSAMDSEATSAVPVPLSPTVLAQVSIGSQSTESLHQAHASRESSPHASFSSGSSPSVHGTALAEGSSSAHGSPHSLEHSHHSQSPLSTQPFQPSDEALQHISEDVEFSEPNVPDHESLFGPTEEYLKAEKEIQEQREQLHQLQVAHTHTNGQFHSEQEEDGSKQCSYMDEDLRLADHEQTEELAVKVYADEYEATLAAASCSSTSLSSSLGEE